MAVDVIVPPLSQTMDTLVLVEWLKAVGEEVSKGDPLFIVETDKANLDIEAPASGILRQVFAGAGDEVKVRSRIGVIAAPGEEMPPAPGAQPAAELETPEPLSVAERLGEAALTGPGGQPLPPERLQRVFASPRARRLAQEEGVPLAGVTATGSQHMIVERDVRAYVEAGAAAPVPAETQAPAVTPVARRLAEAAGLDLATVRPSRPGARVTRVDVEAALQEGAAETTVDVEWIEMPRVRQTIARRMVDSQQTAAEVTLMRDVDATALVRLRQRILEDLAEGDPRPTYTDLLLSIVARQLKCHPYANATVDGARVGLSQAVHVAVAVDTERGLVTPVVRHADKKGLLQLAWERAELVRRALDATITPDELTGGTFTVTNLGPLGIDAFTPIINPPQTAILGVGRIRPAPAVYDGELCIRQKMFLSLTFDHRAIDGAPAARFLQDVVRMIEKPHLMWL